MGTLYQADLATEADFAVIRADKTRTKATKSDKGANMKKKLKPKMTVMGRNTRLHLKCRSIAASVVIGLGMLLSGGSTGSAPSNP